MLVVDANVWVAAYDPRDRFHEPSVHFLVSVARNGVLLTCPTLALVETACAVARRAGDAEAGLAAQGRLSAHPMLTLHPMTDRLMDASAELGTRLLLRGADAIYAATAAMADASLISWDAALVTRAGAHSPSEWLAASG